MNLKSLDYKWYILFLAATTNAVVVALPMMSLSVLFHQISVDLKLSLVQVGLIWGIGALPGLLSTLFAGVFADRFGPRKVIIVACVLTGILGALRGFASDFNTMLGAMIVAGFVTPLISVNTVKTAGVWFTSRQLGLANGFLSMGMALGFLAGSMLSATVISPWVGGWRNVLILYGALAVLFAIPWTLSRAHMAAQRSASAPPAPSMRQAFGYVARKRNIWMLGLAVLGIGGAVQGTLGYLPLYLRGQGWPDLNADAALASFHLLSMLTVIPVALFSDRPGVRKKVFVAAASLITLGMVGLTFASGGWVWLAVGVAGLMRDGFMAIFLTSVIETDGIGPLYAGSAIGVTMVLSSLGTIIAPPLGNSLAAFAPSAPFGLWAGMAMLGIVAILFSRGRSAEAK
jgi:MFS family permease